MNKKNPFLSLLLLIPILISLFPMPVAALEDPDLQCRNAILYDAQYGEILYEKAAYDKAYPASLTKMMTALLVMEAIDDGTLTPDTMITANENAVHDITSKSSTAGIKPGHTLSVNDLLYCLLLPSANEAANILAEAVDGSIRDFVEHMNQRAASLGCKGTHFVNPHGLHDDNHYTTAYDMALIMDAALDYDLFRTIISTPSYTIPANENHPEFYFFNTNGLISNLHYWGYIYDKCIGGKTGTTEEAGRCLASAAESGEDLLISVIMGSGVVVTESGEQKQGQFTESIKLLDWGFNNFQRVTITQDAEPVDKVTVTLSREADEVLVKPQGSITRTIPKDMDLDKIETEISLFSPTVEAPVKEGQPLGIMKLSYEGESYGTLDLVAVTSVERSELLYKKAQITEFFQTSWVKLLLAAVAILVVVIVLKLFVFRKTRRYRGSSGRSRGNYRGSRR